MSFSEPCTVCNRPNCYCHCSVVRKVLQTLQKLRCTEFANTEIGPDSVKFYCRHLVKLGLRHSKLIKLKCIQYRYQFSRILQEGQHPLTGQHTANFKLLANQWAERSLVTQWRHAFRAIRQSVCNAGASNAGRSLCIQVSREQSYPLPIYWYHSKGNWLCYNFAAERFYIMKLCSRLFVLHCRSCPKDDKFR